MNEELYDFTIHVQVLAESGAEAQRFLENETQSWKATAFGEGPIKPSLTTPPFVNDFEIEAASIW